MPGTVCTAGCIWLCKPWGPHLKVCMVGQHQVLDTGSMHPQKLGSSLCAFHQTTTTFQNSSHLKSVPSNQPKLKSHKHMLSLLAEGTPALPELLAKTGNRSSRKLDTLIFRNAGTAGSGGRGIWSFYSVQVLLCSPTWADQTDKGRVHDCC